MTHGPKRPLCSGRAAPSERTVPTPSPPPDTPVNHTNRPVWRCPAHRKRRTRHRPVQGERTGTGPADWWTVSPPASAARPSCQLVAQCCCKCCDFSFTRAFGQAELETGASAGFAPASPTVPNVRPHQLARHVRQDPRPGNAPSTIGIWFVMAKKTRSPEAGPRHPSGPRTLPLCQRRQSNARSILFPPCLVFQRPPLHPPAPTPQTNNRSSFSPARSGGIGAENSEISPLSDLDGADFGPPDRRPALHQALQIPALS